MQSGNRQHMGETGIAQRLFIIIADAATLAGDQGGSDAAKAAGNACLDALRHSQSQVFDIGGNPTPVRWRLGLDDRMRAAIGETHRTDGLKKQRAPQVGGTRLAGRGRRIKLRCQAEPLARPEIERGIPGGAKCYPHPARRRLQGAGPHLIQYGAHARVARLKRDDASRHVRHQGVIQNRRFDRSFAQLGQGKTQQQRGQEH
jgi:hypothetical protein